MKEQFASVVNEKIITTEATDFKRLKRGFVNNYMTIYSKHLLKWKNFLKEDIHMTNKYIK